MKWNFPKPLIISSNTREEQPDLVPSENDPAFSDFNLPLLDQEVVVNRKVGWQRVSPRVRILWPWSKTK